MVRTLYFAKNELIWEYLSVVYCTQDYVHHLLTDSYSLAVRKLTALEHDHEQVTPVGSSITIVVPRVTG